MFVIAGTRFLHRQGGFLYSTKTVDSDTMLDIADRRVWMHQRRHGDWYEVYIWPP